MSLFTTGNRNHDLSVTGASSPATASLMRLQAPLLPLEADGNPLKETSATSSNGKRDKDGKGGGKKGQESKGGKGSKGDPSVEPSSCGRDHTAWPPNVALSSLVDVIATGDMSQVPGRALSSRLWCSFVYRRLQGTVEATYFVRKT